MRIPSPRFPVVLALAVAFCYGAGLDGPAVYDDNAGVFHNPKITDWRALGRGFLDPTPAVTPGVSFASYAYRPLTEASFALNRVLTGPGLPGFRIVGWGLHLLAALLVFSLVSRFGEDGRWASLFFAVHPLAVGAVTYIYQRSVTLEALLAFACLALYARDRSRGRFPWSALLAGLLAMGAKETAATLPLILGVYEWVMREPGDSPRKILARWLPFALLPALVLLQVARAQAGRKALLGQGIFTDLSGFHPLEYLLLQLPILVHYARLHAFPFPLAFCYDRETPVPGEAARIDVPSTILSGALILAAAAWVLFGSRRHRIPRLGLGLMAAPLALESSVFPIKDIAADYRNYPGLLGSGLIFAWGVSRLPAGGLLKAGGALALLASLTLSEVRTWSQPVETMAQDVRHAPHVSAAWGTYAWRCLDRYEAERAERLFRRAGIGAWKIPDIFTGHAYALLMLGRLDEASAEIDRILEAFPDNAFALWLGMERAYRTGDHRTLRSLAQQAQRNRRNRPDVPIDQARRQLESGHPREAEDTLRRALTHFPAEPELWRLLEQAFREQGRAVEALEAKRRGEALNSP